ncbi:MAG TPA: alpha/beta hydrolase [Rhizomicrobium sp.]|jgi:proline iminopeptidase|nr:alpha/beta hydrolase [Rhizomicrobium sp.]
MFVTVNGARIFFDTVGAGLAIDGEHMVQKPTLIVMHGGPGFDHSTLRPYFDRFADTHQVLYIDHRGNGRSTGDVATWNLAQWGDDVKGLCDALGIDKPHVYGNSFGGMVAMAYAARHPEHPAKLILSSTAARMRLDVTYRLMEERGGPEARAVAERFWKATSDEAFADYMRVCSPHYNPPGGVVAEQAAARRRAISRPDVTRHFSLGEMLSMDARPGLAKVVCPTLVTVGDYDPITPVECSEEIMVALPKGIARFALFKGAGHGVHRDQPEAAERVMREFLAG